MDAQVSDLPEQTYKVSYTIPCSSAFRDQVTDLAALAFRPLSAGVRTRSEALHVLGFAPGELPDRDAIRSRFRALATVHHPDSSTGTPLRMSQLNAAWALLNSPR